MNVMAVLTLGLLLSGIIGLCYGAFDFYGWMRAMGDGILNMGLIIITIMAGGLMELIKHNGGINFIIDRMTRHVNSKKGAGAVDCGIGFISQRMYCEQYGCHPYRGRDSQEDWRPVRSGQP